MRSNVITRFSLAVISLCLSIVCGSEAKAQGALKEIMLRNGTVMKANPSMELHSGYLELEDGRRIERSKIKLICVSDCKGAPRESSQQDLVLLKDGRHMLGTIETIVKGDSNRTPRPGFIENDYVMLDYEKIAFSEISYVKFSDNVFYSIQQAVRAPRTAYRLFIKEYNPGMRHLSPNIGRLVNLKELEISCQEELKDLPTQIGNLRNLEKLIIDNGNGCGMNISLPESIGQLQRLRVLRLYGALDPLDLGPQRPARPAKSKSLPNAIAKLRNLEELDLGRNGIGAIPPQIASLRKLKKLMLNYDRIQEIPSFIGNLTSLREISLISNADGAESHIKLPQSLGNLKGLKVFMGNNYLTLKDQEAIRKRFPKVVFSFENDFDDGAINEEPPEPKKPRANFL